MPGRRRARDNELIDALEASQAVLFQRQVWRVVPAGLDPLLGSAAAGRWDDGTFEVLYTSAMREGAIAEMYFHIARGQPVFPSKMAFRLFELEISLRRVLRLANLSDLDALGVETARYGSLLYRRRQEEYRRTQEIGEVAHFLEFDGLIVPCARWECHNVVLFTDRIDPKFITVAGDHGVVDWDAWNRGTNEK